MELKFKKGLNLHIAGAIENGAQTVELKPSVCAVVPDDFPGFRPKPAVKEGDEVACGSPLLFDKSHPDLKIVSPIAGKVKGVVRGDRRKILRVEVEVSDVKTEAPAFPKPADSGAARKFLAESGLLAFFRQRPYCIVPNPDDAVRDIFVTAADFAPLADDRATLGASLFDKADYEAGVEVLRLVTTGKVYVATSEGWPYGALRGAEMLEVSGPYPASNVGVHIAAVRPVDKGDVVWTLDGRTLARIGHMVRTGKFDSSVVVAVTGPEVKTPCLVKTVIGAPVADILKNNLNETGRNLRVISGNVLTGTAVDSDGYLRFPYRQITVIDEGDDVDEFMGWASFSLSHMSESRSFPGHFIKRLFSPDARLHGGRRAMIMSDYDKTVPMDILPEYLIKAILSNNIEDMEKLGIYEVAPEDFAAAEYADTSKLPLQQIVRDGLDYLRRELE